MSFYQSIKLAIQEENSKNYTKAFNLYNDALKYTNNPTTIIKIKSKQAWCNHLVGNSEQSENIYKNILESYPNQPLSYLVYGKYLIKTRRYKQARIFLKQGIELFPDNLELYLTLSSLLKDMDRTNESIDILKKAISQENLTRGRGILRKHIWAELGVLFYSRGDYNSAISSFKKSISMDHESEFYHYDLLGKCYLLVGDPKNAIYYFDKFINYYSNEVDTEIFILKARAYCRLEDYPQASACLLQAYSIEDALQLNADDMMDLAPLKKLGFIDTLENLEIEE